MPTLGYIGVVLEVGAAVLWQSQTGRVWDMFGWTTTALLDLPGSRPHGEPASMGRADLPFPPRGDEFCDPPIPLPTWHRSNVFSFRPEYIPCYLSNPKNNSEKDKEPKKVSWFCDCYLFMFGLDHVRTQPKGSAVAHVVLKLRAHGIEELLPGPEDLKALRSRRSRGLKLLLYDPPT